MKKRNMMLLTSMMLAVLLIAGGTFAWFTASADPVVNEFTMGTLDIKVHENFCPPTNVNPGQCFNKDIWIENTGSKRAVVRIGIDEAFEMAGGAGWLGTDVISYTLGYGWFKKTIGGEDYFVYNRVLGGSNYPWSSEYKKTTNLFKGCICFDGKKMGNEFQGATYTMTVNAEAIQATNGAPWDEWGLKVRWDNWGYGPGGGVRANAVGEEVEEIGGPAIDELGTVE